MMTRWWVFLGLVCAGSEFERHGYAVETLRLVTQPLGELLSGQSEPDALGFLAGDRTSFGDPSLFNSPLHALP